ncbi:sulfotransferase [Streptomyces sp. NBC_00820]|uniref:sulfotransferase family protein n=1 Tax=Streptomyces sp. NBC_00820 TaxID=2975842 RepID=UPI002ED35951|nr:sulfotransferase [Streptomyces sp. NBC_00820]
MTSVGPDRTDGPVLIIGTERSGSNLLRLMLDAHSRITVPHPPHFMRYFAPLAERYGDLAHEDNRARLVADALGLLRRHIHPWPHPVDADRVTKAATPTLFGVVAAIYEEHRRAEGASRWGCKSTFMVDHVEEVLAEYPGARFVWLVREPCDVAASAKRAVFGPSHPYRMALLWRRQQERALAAQDTWGPDVVRLLRYEDLVAAPERELTALCAFLGERMEPAMLAHHTTVAARQTSALSESWRQAGKPVSTSRVGAHRTALTERERLLVDKVTGPVKQALGYPVDPRAPGVAGPSPFGLALRSALLRLRIEARSLRHDRNYRSRLSRDVYVRLLRLRTLHGR